MTHYAPDIVVYDVMQPLEITSAADYRKNIERWFASMLGPIDYEMSELRVSMSDSHAFCHSLSHIKGARKTGGKADYWVRVTTCFQKANGQWLIGHEHVSMPTTL
jgi:ketosteroid isomerase-like protein